MLYLLSSAVLWCLALPLGILMWPVLFVYGLSLRTGRLFVSLRRSVGLFDRYQLWVLGSLLGFKTEVGGRPRLKTVDFKWGELMTRGW